MSEGALDSHHVTARVDEPGGEKVAAIVETVGQLQFVRQIVQFEVFEEAQEVFENLGNVTRYDEDDASKLVHHVSELLAVA